GQITMLTSQLTTHSGFAEPERVAGWPYRYFRSDRASIAGGNPDWWSTTAIVWNLGAAALLVVAAMVTIFIRARKRPVGSTADATDGKKRKRRAISIADLLALTLLAALPFAFYQWMQAQRRREEQELAFLPTSSSYVRSTELPVWVRDYIPSAWIPETLLAAMSRVTDVSLQNPDSDALKHALQLPHLRTLRLGGGDYDLKLLRSLPNFASLKLLHLTGRSIDAETLALIGQMKRLRSLDLSRTNLVADSLKALTPSRGGKIDGLRELALVDTGIRLSDVHELPFRETLWYLHLPRPLSGESDRIELSGLPQLQSLWIHSNDRRLNPALVEIDLQQIPKLKWLTLDRLQKVRIDLEDLPELGVIRTRDFMWGARVGSEESIPGALWADAIKLRRVPKLQQLNVYGTELNRIDSQETPRLRDVGIGVFRHRATARGTESQYDPAIPKETMKSLLSSLATSDGPVTLDLASVPLAGVDLNPLVANERLQNLLLGSSKTTSKEWGKLAGKANLRMISVDGNQLRGRDVGDLIKTFPNLEEIYFDAWNLDRLRVEGHGALKYLVGTSPAVAKLVQGDGALELPVCDALRLHDLPELSNQLRLHGMLNYLSLSNLPKLKGLAIVGPAPSRLSIEGLSGLQWFSGGGE
ncbi:MAG: hypothetical protein AAGA03_19445, partial [Planctomycetota bacterium]